MSLAVRLGALVAAELALGGILVLDVLTGPDIGLSVFYIVPICAIGWTLGPAWAAVVAASAAGCWYVADYVFAGRVFAISTWNAATRFVMYELIGVSLALLRRDRERLSALARNDMLTGLANSRAFRERLADALPLARRRGAPLSIAFIDLDNFKKVNDRFGHSAGDEVLREVADRLRATVRSSDALGRLGGDEFAVILWDSEPDAAATTAQRIIDAIAPLGDRYPGSGLGATAGVAAFHTMPATGEEALKRADEAMYQAKTTGKGQVSLWRQPAEPDAERTGVATRS